MNTSILEQLRCPECRSRLRGDCSGSIATAGLTCTHCDRHYPCANDIPVMLDQHDLPQQEHWENELGPRTSDHPAVKAYATSKLELIKKAIRADGDDPCALKALEVGSGSGYFTRYAAECFGSLIASDYAVNRLAINPHPQKICCDGARLPYEDNAFDCVMCANLLHHVSSPVAFVSEMRRVTRKYVVLLEPNRNNPLMFLFGLLTPCERGLLKINLPWLRQLGRDCKLEERLAVTEGLVLPNKTPESLAPLFRSLESVLRPHFYLLLVGKK